MQRQNGMTSTTGQSNDLPQRIRERAVHLGFDACCEAQTGQLLATLAASKPGGRMLELGTGIGLGTAYLLSGMNETARLDTVELDEFLSATAQELIGPDGRVTFHAGDGAAWIGAHVEVRYDLIFADTWPGKFHDLEEALKLLTPGGIYFIDDLLPQTNWPEGHGVKVDDLRARLEAHPKLLGTRLDWASGLMICVKNGA